MPATRKSTRLSGGLATGKQSTLSFNHRVTKNVGQAGKSALSTTKKQHIEEKAHSPSPKPESEEEEEEEGDSQFEPEVKPVPEKSEAELRAEKIGDKEIKRYWREQENLRIAKRVHQKDLSVGEKVLRYFDVSSQYGPSIGISRLKRWQRAERLGLHPPIEVLAVLVQENERGNKGTEKAYMDHLLNSTAVGSA